MSRILLCNRGGMSSPAHRTARSQRHCRDFERQASSPLYPEADAAVHPPPKLRGSAFSGIGPVPSCAITGKRKSDHACEDRHPYGKSAQSMSLRWFVDGGCPEVVAVRGEDAGATFVPRPALS